MKDSSHLTSDAVVCATAGAKCAAVPLVEQLRSVPSDAVLRIDTPNALGCVDTRSIPVGRLCHEAAARLGADNASLTNK